MLETGPGRQAAPALTPWTTVSIARRSARALDETLLEKMRSFAASAVAFVEDRLVLPSDGKLPARVRPRSCWKYLRVSAVGRGGGHAANRETTSTLGSFGSRRDARGKSHLVTYRTWKFNECDLERPVSRHGRVAFSSHGVHLR